MPPNYGLQSKSDIGILQSCLSDIIATHETGLPVAILEIGVWTGETARGMRDFLKSKGTSIDYTGIENGTGKEATSMCPFAGAMVIHGDSITARSQIGNEQHFDLILIDGCHCLTHACMDFLCYQSLVVPGGFALFHDINPAFQGVDQHHASKNHDAMPMEVAVVDALKLLGLLDGKFAGWSGSFSKYEPDCSNGFFIGRKFWSIMGPEEI